jgi:sterol desaturase/sphingolipid hydroxylase (fatty acid hydroxylase superfamily)
MKQYSNWEVFCNLRFRNTEAIFFGYREPRRKIESRRERTHSVALLFVFSTVVVSVVLCGQNLYLHEAAAQKKWLPYKAAISSRLVKY